MNEFTKGPWEWVTSYGACWLKAGDDYVIGYAGCGSHSAEVGEADARLIAAAPDLLEALERVLPQYITLMEDCGLSINDTVEEARAAIAKARGK